MENVRYRNLILYLKTYILWLTYGYVTKKHPKVQASTRDMSHIDYLIYLESIRVSSILIANKKTICQINVQNIKQLKVININVSNLEDLTPS